MENLIDVFTEANLNMSDSVEVSLKKIAAMPKCQQVLLALLYPESASVKQSNERMVEMIQSMKTLLLRKEVALQKMKEFMRERETSLTEKETEAEQDRNSNDASSANSKIAGHENKSEHESLLKKYLSCLNMLEKQASILKRSQNDTRHVLENYCMAITEANQLKDTISQVNSQMLLKEGIIASLEEKCVLVQELHSEITKLEQERENLIASSEYLKEASESLQKRFEHLEIEKNLLASEILSLRDYNMDSMSTSQEKSARLEKDNKTLKSQLKIMRKKCQQILRELVNFKEYAGKCLEEDKVKSNQVLSARQIEIGLKDKKLLEYINMISKLKVKLSEYMNRLCMIEKVVNEGEARLNQGLDDLKSRLLVLKETVHANTDTSKKSNAVVDCARQCLDYFVELLGYTKEYKDSQIQLVRCLSKSTSHYNSDVKSLEKLLSDCRSSFNLHAVNTSLERLHQEQKQSEVMNNFKVLLEHFKNTVSRYEKSVSYMKAEIYSKNQIIGTLNSKKRQTLEQLSESVSIITLQTKDIKKLGEANNSLERIIFFFVKNSKCIDSHICKLESQQKKMFTGLKYSKRRLCAVQMDLSKCSEYSSTSNVLLEKCRDELQTQNALNAKSSKSIGVLYPLFNNSLKDSELLMDTCKALKICVNQNEDRWKREQFLSSKLLEACRNELHVQNYLNGESVRCIYTIFTILNHSQYESQRLVNNCKALKTCIKSGEYKSSGEQEKFVLWVKKTLNWAKGDFKAQRVLFARILLQVICEKSAVKSEKDDKIHAQRLEIVQLRSRLRNSVLMLKGLYNYSLFDHYKMKCRVELLNDELGGNRIKNIEMRETAEGVLKKLSDESNYSLKKEQSLLLYSNRLMECLSQSVQKSKRLELTLISMKQNLDVAKKLYHKSFKDSNHLRAKVKTLKCKTTVCYREVLEKKLAMLGSQLVESNEMNVKLMNLMQAKLHQDNTGTISKEMVQNELKMLKNISAGLCL